MNRTPLAVGKGLGAKREADRKAWEARQQAERQAQAKDNALKMRQVARG